MKYLLHFLRPTLVRRVVLPLLAAFVLVWLAVLVQIMADRMGEDKEKGWMLGFRGDVMSMLESIDNPATATSYLAKTAQQDKTFNSRIRNPTIRMQLRDQHGTVLFSNFDTREQTLIGGIDNPTSEAVITHDYVVTNGKTARWSLLMARPQTKLSNVLLDAWDLLKFTMLTTFFAILIPAWIAVASGLRPLQRLSDLIAARKEDDLSPLNLDPKYTELKPLVVGLDSLLAQLRAKIKHEHAFVQDAAHELRTPMAVISAQAHTLAKASNDAERQEAEAQMDHAIARASHLIEQLLQLARMDGQHPSEIRSVDLAHAVRKEMAQAAPSAIARDIELALDAPETLPHALDAHAFQTILHNLLGNAIRYICEGGQIVVELIRHEDRLTLSVADDGPGIAIENRENVFERFYRGVGHDVSGSGLGLAIVKQATERLHGKVVLTDGLGGRGCRFVVELPIALRLRDIET